MTPNDSSPNAARRPAYGGYWVAEAQDIGIVKMTFAMTANLRANFCLERQSHMADIFLTAIYICLALLSQIYVTLIVQKAVDMRSH